MGNCCRNPSLSQNSVGAYGYNGAARVTLCNFLCCFQCKLWSTGTFDGMHFKDPAWAKGTQLRNSFEEYLKGEEMIECLDNAPKRCTMCCGGLPNVTTQAPTLNRSWCPKINEKLLHPAGYQCRAHYWVTYGGKGERYEHMVIVVDKMSNQN